MSVVLSLVNYKGGVGKTTSAIELAACFHNLGYKVLFVDCEERCDATKFCGGDPTLPGLYDVLIGECNIKDAIQTLDEFDLLSSSMALSAAEKTFNKPTDVLLLYNILSEVRDSYDFIVIDTHNSRNVLLNMVYVASNYLIISTLTDQGGVDMLPYINKDLQEFKEAHWSTAEILGVIFSRYSPRANLVQYQLDEIKESLNEMGIGDSFVMTVRDGIAASEVKSEGGSMQRKKKNSNPAMDYRRIADCVVDTLKARGELGEVEGE